MTRTVLLGDLINIKSRKSRPKETGDFLVENSRLLSFEPLMDEFVITAPLNGGASAEVEASLGNMVEAARRARDRLAASGRFR